MPPGFQDLMLNFVDNVQRFAEMVVEAREQRLAREAERASSPPPASTAQASPSHDPFEPPPAREREPSMHPSDRPMSASSQGPIPAAFVRVDGQLIPIFDQAPPAEAPAPSPPQPRAAAEDPRAKLEAMMAALEAERERLRAAASGISVPAGSAASSPASSANVSRYGPDLHLSPPAPPPRFRMAPPPVSPPPAAPTPTSTPAAPSAPVPPPPSAASAQLELPFDRPTPSASDPELRMLLEEERRARAALDAKLTRAMTALAEQEERHARSLTALTDAVSAQARTLDAFMSHTAAVTDKLAASLSGLTDVLAHAATRGTSSSDAVQVVVAEALVDVQESVREAEVRLLGAQREVMQLLRQQAPPSPPAQAAPAHGVTASPPPTSAPPSKPLHLSPPAASPRLLTAPQTRPPNVSREGPGPHEPPDLAAEPLPAIVLLS